MTSRELNWQATKQNVIKSGNRRRSRILSIVASIVVFCVTYALIIPALTWEKTLICELPEHTHGESCYTVVTTPASEELVCELSEHAHDESCYTKTVTYICGLEESVGHTHDETCYDEENNLICGLDEAEGHTHNEECTKIEYTLNCTQDEHAHCETCYKVTEEKTEKKLTCTLQEHTHSESCYDAPPAAEPDFSCGKSAHTHGDKCYTDGILTCTMSEHEHTKQCYSDPKADLESTKTWEASVAGVALTDDWAANVVAVAQSQLGMGESDKNYLVDDSGCVNGYTRYGAWYGSPYADWCAMFCSFCLHYAGVDTMTFPQDASCPRWVSTLSSPDYDLYRPAGEYLPKAGDLIFFDYDSYTDISERQPNHVGIICELIRDEIGDVVRLKTIEGNTGAGVATNTYSLTDGSIMGYAELPCSPVERTIKRAALKATGIEIDAWQEVTAIDDPSARYMIMSSNDYVIGLNNSNSATSMEVELMEVSGMNGYYTANIPEAFQWTIDDTDGTANIINASKTDYGFRLGSGSVVNTTSNLRTNTLSYNSSTDFWNIKYSGSRTYYLACSSTGTFSASTSTSNANMKIYKAVKIGSPGPGGNVVKPEYPDYLDVSDAKTGNTSLGIVPGTYWSDPATSQLEALFEGDPADDGKVLADKSVIYGDDDYDAFNSYAPNTFGVELSALGQKYAITEELQVQVPLDVVFVLDTSGSMINTTYDGVTSANILIESLNRIMKDVMDSNEDNRVGVVCFSGCAHKLLDLGRYTADNDKYFPEGECNDRDYDLTASDSIRRTDGTLYKGVFDAPWAGTFTQDGIAMGAQEFFDANDTTLTKTVSKMTDEGLLNVTYTVTRRPLIILLSDGEPTYCTSDYDKVLESGNVYGNGNTGYNTSGVQINDTTSSANNNKGILGFYTILTAQNYKDRIAQKYNTDAYFYTIGIGMSTDEDNSYEESVAGDDYKRAVLNPTPENIAHLLECTKATCLSDTITGTTNKNITGRIDQTCRMLYRLLHNTQTGTTVRIGNKTDTSGGIRTNGTQANVPIKTNPYLTSGYDYADGAFFTVNNSVETLTAAFSEAVSYTDLFPVYGFILKSNTPMLVSDKIGEGMELKSEPVLRYGGVNHLPTSHETVGNVTTYHYSGTWTATDGSGQTADLSKIVSVVTTDENGQQTVELIVPDSQLATYTPNLRNDGTAFFYYEQLPVRLIYQVGLTDEAVKEIEKLDITGGSKTYYTNAWTDDDKSFSVFTPTKSNPYYHDNDYDREDVPKDDNNTGTKENSREFTEDSDNSYVGQVLGNNGKLTFEPDEFDYFPVTVWKVDANGNPVTTDTAIFALYSDAALENLVDTFETDETGKLVIPTLRTGRTFYLKEIKAPHGYKLLETAIPFAIDLNGKVTGLAASDLYRANEDGELEVLNEDGTITVEVEKHWSGDLLPGESFPTSVLVQLYADGEPVQGAVTLNRGNEWYHAWEELPMLAQSDKHEIVYTVGELDIPENFYPIITQDEETGLWNITNRRYGTTSVSVIKKWVGGEESAVQLELLRNGEPTGRFAKLDASNNWYYLWEDLPDYDANGEIEYTVREIAVEGYRPEIHLWTGPGDPYGQTGSKGFDEQTDFESGKQYILTFENSWDDTTDYPYAVLASNPAHNGLMKLDFATVDEPTDDMLWTASVSGGKVTFTNVGANKQLVLSSDNKVALGTSGHATSWTWTSEEDGNTLLAQYTSSWGYFSRSYTYYFRVMGIENGVGDASSSGYYVPIVPYTYRDTVIEDDVEPGDTHYIVINTKTDYELPDLELTIRKISSEMEEGQEPQLLAGAKFDLYIETGDIADGQIPGTDGRVGKVVQQFTVDGTRKVKIDRNGTYYLVETSAPRSYLPLEEPIVFTVTSDNVARTATVDYHPLIESGTKVTAFDVPNTPTDSYVLPETGGTGTVPYYTTGFLLIAAALVCGCFPRRKKEGRADC